MMFISYSWKDRLHVESLCARMRATGTEYWLDSERLDLERELGPQLLSAVSRATGLILVDSSASRMSRWVELEVSSARSCGTQIVRHPLALG